MSPLIDLTAQRFGRLVVMHRDQSGSADRIARWSCLCDCGNRSTVRGSHLRSGRIVSCGCYRTEVTAARATVHGALAGGATSAEYSSWRHMLNRCDRPEFVHHHGKGIVVCDRWRHGEAGLTGFQCFLADVGPRPSGAHSIDRFPDGTGQYRPGNVRWAVPLEQNNNRNSVRRFTYRGVAMTLREAWQDAGAVVRWKTCRSRVAAGWPLDAAVELAAIAAGSDRTRGPLWPLQTKRARS